MYSNLLYIFNLHQFHDLIWPIPSLPLDLWYEVFGLIGKAADEIKNEIKTNYRVNVCQLRERVIGNESYCNGLVKNKPSNIYKPNYPNIRNESLSIYNTALFEHLNSQQ
jgi:hypothetical protein